MMNDASTIGPRQNRYLKDEIYLTEKNRIEARLRDTASSTWELASILVIFCFLPGKSLLLQMALILTNVIINVNGAIEMMKVW